MKNPFFFALDRSDRKSMRLSAHKKIRPSNPQHVKIFLWDAMSSDPTSLNTVQGERRNSEIKATQRVGGHTICNRKEKTPTYHVHLKKLGKMRKNIFLEEKPYGKKRFEETILKQKFPENILENEKIHKFLTNHTFFFSKKKHTDVILYSGFFLFKNKKILKKNVFLEPPVLKKKLPEKQMFRAKCLKKTPLKKKNFDNKNSSTKKKTFEKNI